ncbi:MAG: hypothetical protein SFX73_27475 [Kofleriaceae bacterium]|nr:hypothetical protein [Kofleriaceae bacterium]
MDLELREALALSPDRSTALAQLLPGSEDHDYYRCLHAQHAGDFASAHAILDAWPERHGHTARLETLRLRLQLCEATAAQPSTESHEQLRDRFGVSHWHEAEVEEVDPSRPSRLTAAAFDGARLLKQAYDQDAGLTQVTDEGLYELLDRELDPTRRRVLLGRIDHTPHPKLVEHIAADLALGNSSGFGSLAIHERLTLAQLERLGTLRPQLRGDLAWVSAMIKRMVPQRSLVDLDRDRDARHAFLVALWQFVRGLPPALNSLKGHILWHLLDSGRQRGTPPDVELFKTYLALPRTASYLGRELANTEHKLIAQLGTNFRNVTQLAPVGNDEELVRALVHQLVDRAEEFAPWLDRAWLDAEIATARLLYGNRDVDRATLTLGPARAAALRERIDLVWCPHNPTRFGTDEPIVLEADVKHVPELHVKVFRIDPLAYFQHTKKEVGPELDLDGLAASHELVLQFAEPPVRRVRRRIELPMCARPGTYVIDLIGNGTSSRAIVHKGRLRHTIRVGAAGHVITIVDDVGRPRPDARAWIGDREYTPDANGSIVVPFSTAPGPTPMLLSVADMASVQSVELLRESPELVTTILLDREDMTAGRTARAIARVRLLIGGAPASVALIKRATWDVTLIDAQGVPTTKSQPLVLTDDDATVLEWQMGDDTAQVQLAIRGAVEVRSEQREHEVSATRSFELATINRTTTIEAMYLAQTASGWVLSALGKTGEPRAQRPVNIGLVHRWSLMQLEVALATDARGRIELGKLDGIARISATLGGETQTWTLEAPIAPAPIHVVAGREVVLPIAPERTAEEVFRRLSLVETNGAPVRHPDIEVVLLEAGIAVRGLPPGEYHARGPGLDLTISVVGALAEIGASAVTPLEVVEQSRRAPDLASLTLDDSGLRAQLRGTTSSTRVHVIATAFRPALIETPPIGARLRPQRRSDQARGTLYVSGRELGDEYRYILERRTAKRFPGLLLERPSLLLNPWSRRATSTAVAVAGAGGAYAPAPAMYASAPAASGAWRDDAAHDADAFLGYDFVGHPPAVIANLVPDGDGVVRVPRSELGGATSVTVIVDDPAASTFRHASAPEPALDPRDLRLALALDPNRHATQHKQITPLVAGDRLAIADLATAKVHLVDTVERAHAYLLALREDATLREFAFVTRWHALADAERRELYSKYACHELHLFLHFKDHPFFDEVVRPYLAHKRVKTFLDHWLLEADLTAYLEPAALGRLNAVERALLAWRLPAGDQLARLLADEVAVQPPDPQRDTRLIDGLIGAATLDGDSTIAAAQTAAIEEEREMLRSEMPRGGFGAPGAPPPPPRAAPAPKAAAKKRAKEKGERSRAAEREEAANELMADMSFLEAAPAPMYRNADKTQEWAENNWWHRTPADSGPVMIPANRLWRDLAQHRATPAVSFLSPGLGLATGSFAEAMCALAVTALPFVAHEHALDVDGPRLAITAASNALAGSSQIVDGELVTGGAPLVVGTSYVRTDDRYDWVNGEQVDKYVEGTFAVGVVYTCQVVLANPTSSRQRIAALVQIPRSSLPVAGARPTQTIEVVLEPYGTHGYEYAFYFPAPGTWSHFPVHVSRGGSIVAAAPPRELEVVRGGAHLDPRSWPFVSQRAPLPEVAAYLLSANLAAIDLSRVAWRLRDRAAYDVILAALEQRKAFDPTLWGYALLHHDAPRLRAWLRALGPQLLGAGPVLDMLGFDAEDVGVYEHLELAPLTNARAHRLGPKLRILNDGLAAQYTRFLELVAHRPAPGAEDLLAATAYLLAQDRIAAALDTFARIDASAVVDRMQYDYLSAYLACANGDLERARSLAARWRAHPVDRWRHRFAALAAMLEEIGGARPAIVDARSREQQHADLATKQPAFELALDRDGIVLHSQHVGALELRFFEMDVELLFSRQPFVQSDVSRFSFIEPGHREQLTHPLAELRVPWPASLRGKNVVVEAVGEGLRKAKVHYANDLVTNVANQVGQLRVAKASDQAVLPATYVKVYARKRGGHVAFYKDGYTDLRGWFDYATLSTGDLDQVERFAILVASDVAGATIVEASPPAR